MSLTDVSTFYTENADINNFYPSSFCLQ